VFNKDLERVCHGEGNAEERSDATDEEAFDILDVERRD
jgi:hypothetical protein